MDGICGMLLSGLRTGRGKKMGEKGTENNLGDVQLTVANWPADGGKGCPQGKVQDACSSDRTGDCVMYS